jgi:ferritin-like metal-binding protein YciE
MSSGPLQELYLDQLNNLMTAERLLLKALPRMSKAAQSPALKQAFTDHFGETEVQVQRLGYILKASDQPLGRKRCKGMEALVEEGKHVIQKRSEPAVRDVTLIASAQKIEHYEIAAYGCVRTYAQLLGNSEAERLLQQMLAVEKAADQKLSQLAEGGVNQAAAAAKPRPARKRKRTTRKVKS